jgi:hypothetical protein
MFDDEQVVNFALSYIGHQRDEIRFVWNGKHASEFHDEHQSFRWALAELILSEPESFPIILVRDLLLEDALWSREAWCAPNHFAGLLSILLQRGGREYLADFAAAMNATFDTYGAAHQVSVSPKQAHGLLEETELQLLVVTDARRRTELESSRDLFRKLIEGAATKGWFTVPPGTPVRNIRVVRSVPRSATESDQVMPKKKSLQSWLSRLLHRAGK